MPTRTPVRHIQRVVLVHNVAAFRRRRWRGGGGGGVHLGEHGLQRGLAREQLHSHTQRESCSRIVKWVQHLCHCSFAVRHHLFNGSVRSGVATWAMNCIAEAEQGTVEKGTVEKGYL